MPIAADIRQQAQVFKALGHPARLAMVAVLGTGERCVCELQALVDLDMSTVSKHLSVLTGVGVLACEKRANRVFYALQRPCVLDMLGCLDQDDHAGSARKECCP